MAHRFGTRRTIPEALNSPTGTDLKLTLSCIDPRTNGVTAISMPGSSCALPTITPTAVWYMSCDNGEYKLDPSTNHDESEPSRSSSSYRYASRSRTSIMSGVRPVSLPLAWTSPREMNAASP